MRIPLSTFPLDGPGEGWRARKGFPCALANGINWIPVQSASSVIEEPRKAVVEATASHRLLSWAFAPTDIASLAFFRVSIGLIFFVSAFRYFTKGWIADFLYPELHFTYYGFSWVKP